MTCELNKNSPLDEIYRLARHYPGGVEHLANRMGIAPGTLYNKLRRQVDTHKLSLEEFSEILDSCEEARVPEVFAPLQALAWRHRHVVVALPDVADSAPAELVELICQVVNEHGQVAALIQDALRNDQVIDSKELDGIEHEMQKAIAAMMALKQCIEQMHADAKAKGLTR